MSHGSSLSHLNGSVAKFSRLSQLACFNYLRKYISDNIHAKYCQANKDFIKKFIVRLCV